MSDQERLLEAIYEELWSLNEDWHSIFDIEKRVRLQNALGLAATPTGESE